MADEDEKAKTDDDKADKDEAKSRKDDAKSNKDDAKSKDDAKNKDAKKKNENTEQSESKTAQPTGPSLGSKITRAFLFTFLATFLTAFLFADPIPNGLRVEFDLMASIKLALIAGVIAAVLRTVAGMLPLFADDHAKKTKSKGEDDDD